MQGADSDVDPLVGEELDGRFRLDGLLGEGGMGRVYRATQLSVERTVAVKVMRDLHGDDPVVKERFLREAKTVATFGHPSIVRMIEFGEDPARGLLYLAMDFVAGYTLSEVVARGPLRHDVALRIIARIASGLAEAHGHDVVHRDLKPDNVMLAPSVDGQVQPLILDFGVALPQSVSVRLTDDGRVCGTPAYMAPEQARSLELGPPADLYAAGVMLFEMLTGSLPIEAATPMALMLKKIQEPAPTISDALGPLHPLPDAVERLVADLLARDTEARMQTADDLVRRIESILGSTDFSLRLDDNGGITGWLRRSGEGALAPTADQLPSANVPAKSAPNEALARARKHVDAAEWIEAAQEFELAGSTDPEDEESHGLSLYMLGLDDEFVEAYGRAYDGFMAAEKYPRAVRCAFWNGLTLMFRRETSLAGAWFHRAERAFDHCPPDSLEGGFVMLPRVQAAQSAGDLTEALNVATQVAAVGEAHGDLELQMIARHIQGIVLLKQGDSETGLAVLDDVMLAVTSGQLPPMVTGLLYCGVIASCQEALALGRSRQWTRALSRWCEAQPSLVAFTGKCLVHRAEVLRVSGDWDEALQEAERARQRFELRPQSGTGAEAWYERAEVHRLRGQLADAEAAYERASDLGCDPQPGLALLRAMQGNVDRAHASIRRARVSASPTQRARVLAAGVEIAIQAEELDEALAISEELSELAAAPGREVVAAMAAYAASVTKLVAGDATAALQRIDEAQQIWREVGAPFELARCRLVKSRACDALGDIDGAELELRAAKREFDRLGAALPPQWANASSAPR